MRVWTGLEDRIKNETAVKTFILRSNTFVGVKTAKPKKEPALDKEHYEFITTDQQILLYDSDRIKINERDQFFIFRRDGIDYWVGFGFALIRMLRPGEE